MCLFFPLNALFFAIDIATWQSQCIDIEGVDYIPKGILDRKFLNHSASLPTNSRAINSDSMVEVAMRVCLDDFQATTPPPKVKTYPLVDFISSELEIQLASLYPSNTTGNPLYRIP